jgi:hypothetical protein
MIANTFSPKSGVQVFAIMGNPASTRMTGHSHPVHACHAHHSAITARFYPGNPVPPVTAVTGSMITKGSGAPGDPKPFVIMENGYQGRTP